MPRIFALLPHLTVTESWHLSLRPKHPRRAHDWIRTSDLCLRRAALLSAELHGQERTTSMARTCRFRGIHEQVVLVSVEGFEPPGPEGDGVTVR